jgi:hypothetical protein
MLTIRSRLHRCWQVRALRGTCGARCARSGRLWTTMDETMDTVAAAAPAAKRTPTVDQEVECPLRDVQLTAGDRP